MATASETAALPQAPDLADTIAGELELPVASVHAVLRLVADGGTVPFIARYRKEATGSLDEVAIRAIQERAAYLKALDERRQTVLQSIAEQGKLTPELEQAIRAVTTKAGLEDLYLPFRPKRRTRAIVAREQGLEPLARRIVEQPEQGDPTAEAAAFVSAEKGVPDAAAALQGARDIVAEQVAEDATIRRHVRDAWRRDAILVCERIPERTRQPTRFESYYDYREPIAKVPSHRFLAVRRGEHEGVLKVHLEADESQLLPRIEVHVGVNPASPFAGEFKTAIADGYRRLLQPSIETELRVELKLHSDRIAIDVFAENVRNLLLAPPLGGRSVVGIDPGIRSGAKCVAVDATGKYLGSTRFHLHREGKGPRPPKGGGASAPPAQPGPNATQPPSAASATSSAASAPSPRFEAATAPSTEPAPTKTSTPTPGSADPANGESTDAAGAATVNAVDLDGSPSVQSAHAASGSAAATTAPPAPAAAAPPPAKPREPERPRRDPKEDLARFLLEHKPAAIAVGNGTHGRETESFVRRVLAELVAQHQELASTMVVSVNEAGASVYSASDVARAEFPKLDVTVRGAVSIARRLQDPLAELVKIDPKAIGVGQYQHDVHPPMLAERLDEVVESCVNHVGVELNTASAPLLARVAGIGPTLAERIVKHREEHGPFKGRRALLEIGGVGPKTFEQCAGFLRIRDGEHPLDGSAVHPERYELVEQIAKDLGAPVKELVGNVELVGRIDFARYVGPDVGEPTLQDILDELKKPGRDPRRTFEPPRFRDDVTKVEDLKPGMTLEGVVTNVTAFGAFVDVGVHQDGLVHVSQLADHFVRDPHEVVKVGDRLQVRVLEVDLARKRIALTAKREAARPQPGARAATSAPPRAPHETADRVAERPLDRPGDRGDRGDRGPRRGNGRDRGERADGGDRRDRGPRRGRDRDDRDRDFDRDDGPRPSLRPPPPKPLTPQDAKKQGRNNPLGDLLKGLFEQKSG